ncbi:MAG: xanthine dehydrogenase family protein molybdopterin-binding subunit [Candidatus Dormibacteraeota bacterium]|nr:xanthine dehydrogenase family protein molybdopterin-binding subunit [Candidatus Dormibacteraeota bacterium]MBO0759802.1 xanthine dehydrogenase family protein molybdopterin-binding subunit [Candidatus Dormibacteraeota bacterium]
MAISRLVGARVQRREDPRLVSGHGCFVDDLAAARTLHMAVVRSPFAHARIQRIDTRSARSAPGVAAVLVAADFRKVIRRPLPVLPTFVPEKKQVPEQFPVATGEVVYEGEPVAVVLAEDRYLASDGAALVEVGYEPLPAVMDVEKALEAGSPPAHTGAPDNVGWDASFPGGDIEAVFAEADLTVRQRMTQQRLIPNAMEGRAVLAQYDAFERRLTLWTSTQIPHFIRYFLSQALDLPESSIRVVAPDVGGGFGSKQRPYPEEYLAAAASLLTAQPVKWAETRTETMQTTTHGRGQVIDVEVAARRDGTLLGLKIDQLLDIGGYQGVFGAVQCLAILVGGGCYRWRAVHGRSVGVLTNKVSTDPYRGAGRPEATHLVERAVDLVARRVGMDPAEVRRQNFAREFPFTNNFGLTFDSGDYQKPLDRALELIDYEGLRRRQAELREEREPRTYLGVGISTYVEICGFGPSAATASATGGIAFTESAHVKVLPTGSVTLFTGASPHGQGHETTFAQIAADALGVPYDAIDVRHGDTAEGPAMASGTYGSRSVAVGGVAVQHACLRVVDKARRLAAHLLESAEEDVVADRGRFFVKGSPDRARTLSELAFAAYGADLPEGMEQGLEATTYFDPPNFTWPFGAHVCAVEVDRETGAVEILRYVAVDDCGNVINPTIVEGQVHGGILQGIAQALYEEAVYDETTGQLKTSTLIDYLVPTPCEAPRLELDATVTPSPTNELGVKGIGEAGTIPVTAAVINAICDALSPLGIEHVDMPASPERLWRLMQGAHASSQ